MSRLMWVKYEFIKFDKQQHQYQFVVPVLYNKSEYDYKIPERLK